MESRLRPLSSMLGRCPVYKQVEKLHHIFNQGYADILPKYTNATGGGKIFAELTRNSIEEAYADITSEARNQYTLGYTPKAIASGSAYRTIEVVGGQEGAGHLYQGGILLDSGGRPIKAASRTFPVPPGSPE